jgi:hypothetical protein
MPFLVTAWLKSMGITIYIKNSFYHLTKYFTEYLRLKRNNTVCYSKLLFRVLEFESGIQRRLISWDVHWFRLPQRWCDILKYSTITSFHIFDSLLFRYKFFRYPTYAVEKLLRKNQTVRLNKMAWTTRKL